MQIKYISSLIDEEFYKKKYFIFNDKRLKTSNLLNIVDMFLNKYIFFNKDSIKLNSRVLKYLYGGSYYDYIQYLIQHNFIFMSKNYSSGLRSKTYKLTKKAKETEYSVKNINIPIRLQNKINIINNNYEGLNSELKTKLIKDLYKVKIDMDECNTWLKNNIESDSRQYFINKTACEKINNNDLYYSFDTYGRFHTNFTCLKKHIRTNFLTIDNQKLKELDITNSQPFFLYLMMKEKGFTNFDNFDNDVLTGKIYDNLKNIANVDRKEAKINVYSILFGRNMTKNYWNKIFNEMYPNVYEWICNYKRKNKNYKIIAHQLQRIESDFIFNNLIPKILSTYNDVSLITVHDSILIPANYYNDIKIIFNNALQELKN